MFNSLLLRGGSLQPGTQFKLLRTFFGEKLAGPITFVSWLRYIFPFSMIYSNIIKAMDSFRILLQHVIEDQRQVDLFPVIKVSRAD